MTTRLSLYNDALLACGERALNSLTENREPRYLLDQIWNNNGVKNCLEEGQWYFAMRTIQLDYDPDIEPPFGYAHAFDKPTDWIRTVSLASDEFFRAPLLRYNDEAGYWYSDLNTIYVRYVSNDDAYGMNLALWPETFKEFVAAHFAMKVVLKITNDEDRFAKVVKIREMLMRTAKSKAAMADATQFPVPGSWSQSRRRGGFRSDGGSQSGNLY